MLHKVAITITDTDVNDILDSALNYATYWAEEVKSIDPDNATYNYQSEALTHGAKLKIKDGETGKWHVLTLKKMLTGIGAAIVAGELDLMNFDGPQSDCALQHALFGEVVYG